MVPTTMPALSANRVMRPDGAGPVAVTVSAPTA